MPIEVRLLESAPIKIHDCPICKRHIIQFLRGQIQRSRRFLWILWKRDYCAIICNECNNIIGWESPENYYNIKIKKSKKNVRINFN